MGPETSLNDVKRKILTLPGLDVRPSYPGSSEQKQRTPSNKIASDPGKIRSQNLPTASPETIYLGATPRYQLRVS
jgi:hypothetical protein